MPELPEVETVRRGLAPVMLGARIDKVVLRRADIRFPFPASFEKRLTGRRIVDMSRRAKYLLFRLDSDETLIAHLGMSGSFRIEKTRRFRRPDRSSTNARRIPSTITSSWSWIMAMSSPTTTPAGLASWTWRRPGARRTSETLRARRRTARARLRRALPGEAVRRRPNVAEGGVARSKTHRRTGQHLCVRGPVSRPPRANSASPHPGGRARRPDPRRGRDRRGDPQCARGSDRGRRLDPPRSPASKWRTRIFPARLQGLRSRRAAVREGALSRDHRQDRAFRALDLLLSGLPEVAARLSPSRPLGRHPTASGERADRRETQSRHSPGSRLGGGGSEPLAHREDIVALRVSARSTITTGSIPAI
jgi:hypothetical protein